LQERLDVDLRTIDKRKPSLLLPENQLRAELTVSDCSIVVFSDAHYWPDLISTAHMALIEVIQTLPNVEAIVANGDLFDGATTGRHARIGWATTPTTKQELEAVQDRLGEIEAVAPKGAKLIRTWGNHDIRFDSRLSNAAPEYEGIHGLALSDHLPMWKACWSLMVNETVMIKHRYHNGIHATYNNILKSGARAIVTGHLHRLCITPWGDYTGRKWGVDTGTLADPNGPQFSYAEDNPKPHCSGFAVLTFDDKGEMLPPELCEVINGRAYFRGRRVDV
jgi:predicted phosphodiesterase